MENSFEDIIGEDAAQYIHLIYEFLNELDNFNYTFIDENEFKSQLIKDPSNAQAQYMKEILYRANFSSLSAISRNYEWLMGMESAYEQDLYLPFASSFRCLIESVADSYHSLASLGSTLAKSFKHIDEALKGNVESFVLCSELEDLLIHYTHGRRLGAQEIAPDTHMAKTASNYVKTLDDETHSQFYDCYSELCQLSHPAAQGVLHMMLPLNEENFIFEHRFGKQKINSLLNKYKHIMPKLLTFGFNPSIISLKVINELKFVPLYVKGIDYFSLDHLVAWQNCKKDIHNTGI